MHDASDEMQRRIKVLVQAEHLTYSLQPLYIVMV